ncbi:MAG TPA: hypothetical protein PKA37_05005 [Planctomycetota bacterium]|jgi:hypothetical protein|nr:hypothetical protein [Planctomycetota bacterium]
MKEEHLEKQVEQGGLLSKSKEWWHLAVGALGIIFLGLVAIGVAWDIPPASTAIRKDLEDTRASLEHQLGETRINLAEHGDNLAREMEKVQGISARIDGELDTFDRVSLYSESRLRAWREGKGNVVRFGAPAGLVVDAERGFNRVRFVPDVLNSVALSGHLLERSVGGGAFERIALLPSGQVEHEDRGVRPGVAYAYRVASLTEESFVPEGERMSAFSSVATVVGATDFRLSLLAGNKEQGNAELQVEKWHNDRWWTKVFTVREGEDVGALDTGTGVNYGTRQKISKLEFVEDQRRETLKEVVFDASGRVALEGEAPKTESTDREIRFLRTVLRVEGGDLPPQTLEHEQKR